MKQFFSIILLLLYKLHLRGVDAIFLQRHVQRSDEEVAAPDAELIPKIEIVQLQRSKVENTIKLPQ